MIELPYPFLLQRVQSSRCYAGKAGYSDKTKMAFLHALFKNCEGRLLVFQIKYKTDPAEKKVKDLCHVSKTVPSEQTFAGLCLEK